jgi:hypothetical protein
MAEDVQAGPETLAREAQVETEAYGPPRSRLGIALAAGLAVIVSAALAWWLAAPDRSAQLDAQPAPATAPTQPAAPEPPAAAPAPPLRYAAAEPDPDQVRRAWNDVRQTYSDGGPEALVRSSQACARAAPANPQTLDYCLAYDIYSAEVAPSDAGDGQGGWFAGSGDRGLALARSALPDGVDAHNRLAQVAALTTAVLPKAKPEPPRPQAAHVARRRAAKPHLLKVRRVHRPVAGRPHLVKASLHRRPVERAAPAPPVETPRPLTPRQAETLDDFLNQAPPGEPIDPPH